MLKPQSYDLIKHTFFNYNAVLLLICFCLAFVLLLFKQVPESVAQASFEISFAIFTLAMIIVFFAVILKTKSFIFWLSVLLTILFSFNAHIVVPFIAGYGSSKIELIGAAIITINLLVILPRLLHRAQAKVEIILKETNSLTRE